MKKRRKGKRRLMPPLPGYMAIYSSLEFKECVECAVCRWARPGRGGGGHHTTPWEGTSIVERKHFYSRRPNLVVMIEQSTFGGKGLQ